MTQPETSNQTLVAVATLTAGLALVAFFWWTAWYGEPPLRHVTFFWLWLGYILTVDALIQFRGRRSLLRRAPPHLAFLFVLSSPVWWFWEGVNARLQNWQYLGGELFGPAQYVFWASLAFSTVIPAMFETAELLGTFTRRVRFGGGWRWFSSPQAGVVSIAAGVASLAGLLALPQFLFPVAWIFPFLILDGVNLLRGHQSLLRDLAQGNARRFLLLGAAGVICGFFWEMWNWNAYPKWIYTIPAFDFLRIFEMPLLGYGGYVPFAWSLWSLYQFVMRLTGRTPVVTLADPPSDTALGETASLVRRRA